MSAPHESTVTTTSCDTPETEAVRAVNFATLIEEPMVGGGHAGCPLPPSLCPIANATNRDAMSNCRKRSCGWSSEEELQGHGQPQIGGEGVWGRAHPAADRVAGSTSHGTLRMRQGRPARNTAGHAREWPPTSACGSQTPHTSGTAAPALDDGEDVSA